MKINSLYTTYYVYKCIADLIKWILKKGTKKLNGGIALGGDMYKPKEKDWRLLKSKISNWQEEYMEGLVNEYIKYLKSDLPASEKFWTLEKRLKSDKKKKGVLVDLSRSQIFPIIISLIQEGAIAKDDLEEFSDELKNEVNLFMANANCPANYDVI